MDPGSTKGQFHIVAFTDVEPGHWGGHQVSGHETDVSNHILLSTANFWHHSQVDPGSRRGQFHIGAITDVESGHKGGHQVSGRGNSVSNHVL